MSQNAIILNEEKKTAVVPYVVGKALLEGKVVFVGEYRGGLAVEFPGKGGKLYHQSKQSVESFANSAVGVSVQEFLPDGMDWQKWKPEIERGKNVMGVVRTLDGVSGVSVAGAKLEPL